ncbi:hypothetical protein [Gordonia amarae]|uniref:hypothetical protein n=1 Tax=Gordonia amarae TaxID=36821 RepID=UPI000301FAF5|nr:hypothetical protein [Gordonia amarae]
MFVPGFGFGDQERGSLGFCTVVGVADVAFGAVGTNPSADVGNADVENSSA